jgi:hypothetical protein
MAGRAMRSAKLVGFMAETGIGSDLALQEKSLPMRVHYYSPVPDLDDLAARDVWQRRSSVEGLDWQPDKQLDLLQKLGRGFGAECNWPHHASGDSSQFFTNNSGFSYGCAAVTYSLIRRFRPNRIIEVGSGLSTRLMAQAVRRNKEDGFLCEFSVIDPHVDEATRRIPGVNAVIDKRVEMVDLSDFINLSENDILFVDSGHTVRTGGDVNFLILDVLPVLKPGVLCHFHDIPFPYEYSKAYFTNPSFRVFWTESYLLQAFLSFNSAFEILLPMNFLMTDHKGTFDESWEHYDPEVHKESSHSFWIRRK